ncbi:MAG TPA: TerC family protein [Bacteroidia bacterium]|nr:TerC family protein [Bacteroidia bacterium]
MQLQDIFGDDPAKALLVVLNLILIESLLSVDNAAVLATMVMDLPKHQRGKALKYGIFGAYFFRGICLLLAAWLTRIWWLKAAGGVYLIFLGLDYFRTKATPKKEDDILNKQHSWLYRRTIGWMGPFWSTVVLVEIMDLAFSIDNVFAAVAFTDNIWLIVFGVFIGILTMRFVAQGFVRLMERYPFLEKAAFIVITILGIKLTLSLVSHFDPNSLFSRILEGHEADLYTSIGTASIFFVPVLTSILFGWPAKKKKPAQKNKTS